MHNSTPPETAAAIDYRFRLTERDDRRLVYVGDRFSLMLVVTLGVFPIFSLGAAMLTAGLLYSIKYAAHDEMALVTVFVLLVFLIPAYIIVYILFTGILSCAPTRLEFLLNEKKTVITRFGFLKRHIPELPSRAEISSAHKHVGGTRYTAGFSGFDAIAVLRFEHYRTAIFFLQTDRAYDFPSREEAEDCVIRGVREICGLLGIQSMTRKAARRYDRWIHGFLGMVFTFISGGIFYLAFQLKSQDGFEDDLGPVAIGCCTAALAVWFFRRAFRPMQD